MKLFKNLKDIDLIRDAKKIKLLNINYKIKNIIYYHVFMFYFFDLKKRRILVCYNKLRTTPFRVTRYRGVFLDNSKLLISIFTKKIKLNDNQDLLKALKKSRDNLVIEDDNVWQGLTGADFLFPENIKSPLNNKNNNKKTLWEEWDEKAYIGSIIKPGIGTQKIRDKLKNSNHKNK